MTTMTKTTYLEMVLVTHKGTELMLDKWSFDFLRKGRSERIEKQDFFKAGTPTGVVNRDRLAMAGIQLEVGGEVTGAELAIVNGPMSEGFHDLNETFGKGWHEDW